MKNLYSVIFACVAAALCTTSYGAEPSDDILDSLVTTVYSTGTKNTREVTLQELYDYGIPDRFEKNWVENSSNRWSLATKTWEGEIEFFFTIDPAENEANLSQVSVDGEKLSVYEKDRLFNQFVYRAEEEMQK